MNKINLSENNFTEISWLTQYFDLQTLIINHNYQLQGIPKNNWKNLKILKLRDNNLTQFQVGNLLYDKEL